MGSLNEAAIKTREIQIQQSSERRGVISED